MYEQSKKHTIAIITFLCPYPVSDGGRFGVFSFVNDVRKLLNVTLVFKVSPLEQHNVEELKKIWPDVDIRPLYTNNSIKTNATTSKTQLYKKVSFYLKKLKKTKKRDLGKPVLHHLYPFSPKEKDFIDFLEKLFFEKKFDIVQIEYSDMLNLVHIIPNDSKKVFFQHENRFLILNDYFRLYNDKSLYASYVINTAKFTEIGLMNLYDRILILNENDKQTLSKHIPPYKLQVMPTTVPKVLIPNCKPVLKAERLVFLGSQEHPPNKDAVEWFSGEMYDQVLTQTNLRLYVTGKWEEEFKIQHPKVNFTGFVDDIGAELIGGILIAPIRLGGGGIRIKILRAMACGVPVVATSLITNGMQGLEYEKNIFIAETPDDFINAIKLLSHNDEVYSMVSKNSIKLIDDYYSEVKGFEVKKQIFNDLLDNI